MIYNFPANITQTKSDLWHKQLCIKGISNIALISVKQLNSDTKEKKISHREAWKRVWGGREGWECEEYWNAGRLFRKSLKNNPYLFSVIYY